MGEDSASVDVRDMLCAQALARIAKAVGAVQAGERVAVRFNAEDVRRDIISWVVARGHAVEEQGGEALLVERKK